MAGWILKLRAKWWTWQADRTIKKIRMMTYGETGTECWKVVR